MFMFCPHWIHSMRVPTKFKCFICLETIRNEFMPLGKDLLAAKLNYLQRGGCCKKKWKKVKNFDIMEKNRSQIFFFLLEEGFSIRNYLRNSIKMMPMLYNSDFWRKLVVFVVKQGPYGQRCVLMLMKWLHDDAIIFFLTDRPMDWQTDWRIERSIELLWCF